MVLLGLLITWVAIYLLSLVFPLDRYGFKVTPIYIMYKTERFNSFLSRIAEKNKKIWRNYANIGVVVAIIEIAFAIYLLTLNLQRFLFIPQEAEPILPVLPGITIQLRWFPYILIAFGLAITTHEMAHGVLAFLEKIPIKSSGLVLAPITFGAFVEPDDEVFDRSPLLSKLRVLAVGSLTNLVTGLLTLLLLTALFMPSSGVLTTTVPASGPAYMAGIRPWDVIYSINGIETHSVPELIQYMTNIGPGTRLLVETPRGMKVVITEESSLNISRGVMGVSDLFTYYAMRVGEVNHQLSYHLYMTLSWTLLLMMNLAIFNMLPLFPFDGEAFIYSLLKEKLKKGLNASRIAINMLSISLLVSNVVLTFLKFGFIII